MSVKEKPLTARQRSGSKISETMATIVADPVRPPVVRRPQRRRARATVRPRSACDTSARELTVKWAPVATPGGVYALQTAIVYIPALLAAVTPGGESSKTTQR